MIRALLARLQQRTGLATSDESDYAQKRARELATFSRIENVHALPAIFSYWSQRYLRHKFLEMGVRGIHEFFFDHMLAACQGDTRIQRFVSIGSGHSDIEVQVAKMLREAGATNFVLECMDINPDMLTRAEASAEQQGVSEYMQFTAADARDWQPGPGSYSLVMAHQSLHHIVELELLFEKIRLAIGTRGRFLTSDVIGRNGHMRWPEAMAEIERIWPQMPDRCKYNHALQRFEPMYENWDCSTEGFEGIRAQDILPLLRQSFHFEMFLAYGNLIDIFIDRAFGHNFDPQSEEDRNLIDRIASLDEELIEAGRLSPTHLVAIMRARPVEQPRYYKHLSPEFCTRKAD